MDPIYEITAAPHMSAQQRNLLPAIRRPEYLAGWLNLLVEDHADVEVTEIDGEIYIFSTPKN